MRDPTDRNVRQEIDKAVLDATREKLFAELVPNVQIDDIRITPLNAKEGAVIKNVGIATVKMYGLTINGIMIREGRKGLFVQMPQYQSRGQYRDTVYGITTAILLRSLHYISTYTMAYFYEFPRIILLSNVKRKDIIRLNVSRKELRQEPVLKSVRMI